jgi:uncharacterized membrane protein HdeD (DUF308 family)
MLQTLIRNWWLLALRGLLAAVFAAVTFLMQNSAGSLTLREFAQKGMVVFLGMLALAAGGCTVAAGIWSSTRNKGWLLVLDGLAVSTAGLILILSDRITFNMTMDLLVALALVIGLVEVVTARTLSRHIRDEWFLGLAGVASIGIAVAFLWVQPEEAGQVFLWLGVYSAFSAICMLGFALRLRNLRRSIHKIAAA